jgi:ABC-type transport system involved in multi-copper enzyme maturation permease subunit
MRDLIAIAQNTFGRATRQKSLYFLLLSCVVIVGAMGMYGILSIGRQNIMMLDAALAFSLIVGLLTAMSASFEIPRELKEQTAQLILSKPLGRAQFVIGKFLGVSLLCLFNVAFVCIGSALVIYLQSRHVPAALYSGCLLIAGEAVILTAVGIFLSLFMNDVLAMVGVFVIFALGHAVHMLPRVLASGAAHQVAVAISNLLPNFYHLDFKSLIGSGMPVGYAIVVPGVLYALSYAVALTSVAVAVFQHQDIH